MKALTKTLGAWPFFCAVFLNAFVDLGHKITVQNTIFKLYSEQSQIIATAVLNALILLPFILLLSPAGFISDRFARVKVMRVTAWAAVGLCVLIYVSYSLGWFWMSFAATFLLAAQSAIYGPAKMSFIKELFGSQRLAEANGVVSALSIIAILAGTFAFSISFEHLFDVNLTTESEVMKAVAPIGLILIVTSIFELIFMYRLPLTARLEQSARRPVFDVKAFLKGKLFAQDLAPFKNQKSVRLSIVGLATFWGIGQVMLAAYPAYFKSVTGVDNTIVVQGILACSGLGIALGAFMAGRISKNKIELGYLPISALGIAIMLAVLPSLSSAISAAVAFFIIGTCGGMFIVPLNSLIQFQAKKGELGKTLAANNWVQNVSMFSFLALTASFAIAGIASEYLLYIIAGAATVGFVYTLYLLPQSFLRILVLGVLKQRYSVSVQNMKNIPAEGGALLLGNHISWIDWAIVQMASPRPVRFVMAKNIYNRWYLRWFFDLAGCIPIEQGVKSRSALDQVKTYLERGELVCLFPEGTISRTGQLVEFRKGYERACDGLDTSVPIIPFYIHGLWGSQFSRSEKTLQRRNAMSERRKLIVAIGEPVANDTKAEDIKQLITALSVSCWQKKTEEYQPLGRAWVDAACKSKAPFCVADNTGVELSGRKALIGSIVLSRVLKRNLKAQNIGVLLPSSVAGSLTNFALLLRGKTLVNLNYSVGQDSLSAAIEKAEIATVISSKKFEQKLKLKGFDLSEVLDSVEVVYLEDIKELTPILTKVVVALSCYILPSFMIKSIFAKKANTNDTAAILFSSGSEGSPKGICLSHKNIQSNVAQTLHVLNPVDHDVVLGNLPLFHAFGLTVTQFLPLLHDIPVAFHVDPTDALGNAKLVTKYQASIMFGTSTFFRLYVKNRKVHPLMLSSLRIVVSGAEKLNAQVQQSFAEKFSKEIYEGYGATEATPVISVNLPDQISADDYKVQVGKRAGSVGLPLPGTSIRIVDPESFEPLTLGEEGMILIGGVQLMKSYLKDEVKTKDVLRQIGGQCWYVTGDKGKLDEDGFLYIVDRYSRFAKVGGEMISLGQVETAIYALYAESEIAGAEGGEQELELALVSVADEKRGEKLILLSNKVMDSLIVSQNFQAKGLSNLALPADKIVVDEIPKLGSGKVDYKAAKELCLSLIS